MVAQDVPELVMRAMLKMAGGGDEDEMNLQEFIIQAEEYRDSGDVADQVFKVLNLMGSTHPFHVLRIAEIRSWIEQGDYDRIIRGEYQRRSDPDPAYGKDLREATSAYAKGAKDLFGHMAGAAKRMADEVLGSKK